MLIANQDILIPEIDLKILFMLKASLNWQAAGKFEEKRAGAVDR